MSAMTGNLSQVLDGESITSRRWTTDDAYGYCETLARAHYENFPVGSFLVPKKLRKHFYSIYAFARIADDFADEGYGQGYGEEERLEWMARWLEKLRASFAGQADHPVFIALARTATQFDLPRSLFEDLLSAFSQDVTCRRYETVADLMDYCRRSADPIGRLLLLLFGYKNEEMHRWSDCICSGLQLANHWQDVAVDWQKGRVYLPQEDLAEFGLTTADLERGIATEAFRRLMEFEVARARQLMVNGKPLCAAVNGRLALELRAIWLGGMKILERIQKNEYDVFLRRPTITSADKFGILYRSMTGWL
jgi:squalene synthase HpnC